MHDRSKVDLSLLSLKHLVETRMDEILRKEQDNRKYVRLYGAGEYWHAFEESAFQLSLIFKNGEAALFKHKDYPSPVVMASIPDKELRAYIRQHILVCDKPDYRELSVPELSAAAYRSWHERTMQEFM